MKTMMRQRTIRAHALRASDQVEVDHRWWVVERPLVAGETVKWTDKDGDHEEKIPTFNSERIVCLLIHRGSRKKALITSRITPVKILRPA